MKMFLTTFWIPSGFVSINQAIEVINQKKLEVKIFNVNKIVFPVPWKILFVRMKTA